MADDTGCSLIKYNFVVLGSLGYHGGFSSRLVKTRLCVHAFEKLPAQPSFPIAGPTGPAAIELRTTAREQPGQGGGFLAPHVERLFQLHRLDSGADRQGPGEGYKASMDCRLAESTLRQEHVGVH